VTIEATATTALSRFNLDFAGLTVRSVKVDGKPARHERDKDELILTPATGLARGKAFTAEIAYDGVPGERSRPGLGSTGFLHTPDGAFAVGQPESAATWYPVNDHPLDKATYRIEITAPERLAALSNGVLVGTTKAGGWATSTWEVRQPMASYLSTVAIGNYRVKTATHKGKPFVTAVAASLSPGAADEAMARTTELIDFLETRFGPYPFDAYGGIVVDDDRIGFALETQTRPVYSAKFFTALPTSRYDKTWVVAHEVAHQWFGDSVSVHHWRDIWLNEGFATYAQWLWAEHVGEFSAQTQFDQEYADANASIWETPPGDPGPSEIFSRSVYRRGGMAVHALRMTVGDDAFFRILKTWSAEKRNGNATTAEFITVAERVSGRSLRPLFDAWLFGKSRPPKPAQR
jgi:aminopeptidase N